METITRYKCECCHTVYDTAENCQVCEESHIQPDDIISANWNKGSKYPSFFLVATQDNHIVRYNFNADLGSMPEEPEVPEDPEEPEDPGNGG